MGVVRIVEEPEDGIWVHSAYYECPKHKTVSPVLCGSDEDAGEYFWCWGCPGRRTCGGLKKYDGKKYEAVIPIWGGDAITVKLAASILGVTVDTIYRYVREGVLKQIATGKGVYVARQSVESLRTDRSGRYITLIAAQQIFQCGQLKIQRFIDTGELKTEIPPWGTKPMILRSSFEELCDRHEKGEVPPDPKADCGIGGRYIGFVHACKILGCAYITVRNMMDSGELETEVPFGHDKPMILRSSFEAVCRQRNARHMTQREAMVIYRCKREMILRFIELGELEVEKVPGRVKPMIVRASFEAMCERNGKGYLNAKKEEGRGAGQAETGAGGA